MRTGPLDSAPSDAAFLARLRARLRELDGIGGARRAAAELVRALPSASAISVADATAVLELGATIERTASDADLTAFLRSGRLPDVVALSPRQMELMRGGRVALTAVRGVAPITILEAWANEKGKR